ncbi:MAG: hypothetical protein Q7J16_02760 [Candidatus Cloacimonadales bacterium]|nr:hypothetical protein [Candidatus Cloacimonadales bacterium]
MRKVEFRELLKSSDLNKNIRRVFYVIENGESKMMQAFNSLERDIKDDIKDLISKMAIHENYKSDKIKWNLHQYDFGEIRPFPHRFFFFQKCGNNIIFFDYYLDKKKDRISDEIYKRINKRKERYEQEFRRYFERS